MQDETNNVNATASIYSGDPGNDSPERQAEKEAVRIAMQARLPKFRLEEGEEFLITESELVDIHDEYFQMLDSMKAGFSITGQEMRSYMESVVFASYRSRIEKLQRDRERQNVHRRNVDIITGQLVAPGYKRRLFRRKRPNYPMQLCLREADIEAQNELAQYVDDIARQEEFVYDKCGSVLDIFRAMIDNLPKRQRRRYMKNNKELYKQLETEIISRTVPPQHTAPVCEEKEKPADEITGAVVNNTVSDVDESGDYEEAELDELYELEAPAESEEQSAPEIAEPDGGTTEKEKEERQ